MVAGLLEVVNINVVEVARVFEIVGIAGIENISKGCIIMILGTC